jgi:hypothetical protein
MSHRFDTRASPSHGLRHAEVESRKAHSREACYVVPVATQDDRQLLSADWPRKLVRAGAGGTLDTALELLQERVKAGTQVPRRYAIGGRKVLDPSLGFCQ